MPQHTDTRPSLQGWRLKLSLVVVAHYAVSCNPGCCGTWLGVAETGQKIRLTHTAARNYELRLITESAVRNLAGINKSDS